MVSLYISAVVSPLGVSSFAKTLLTRRRACCMTFPEFASLESLFARPSNAACARFATAAIVKGTLDYVIFAVSTRGIQGHHDS